MSKGRLITAIASAISAVALFSSTALAEQVPIGSAGLPRPGNEINVGDSMNVSIGAQAGAGELFRMAYPGGNQPVVINARIEGNSNTDMDAIGFDVYDSANMAAPVEHVTLARNEFNSDPHLMMFAYSSNNPGTTTFQFFNWSKTPLTIAVMPIQLPVALVQSETTVPGSANPVGISGVAGASISRG